jgi:hypothetical protein
MSSFSYWLPLTLVVPWQLLGCQGQIANPLGALADSVTRSRALECGMPDHIGITPGDTISGQIRRLCATTDRADTMIILSYDADDRILSVTRFWRAQFEPTEALTALRVSIEASHGPARACTDRAAPGLRDYFTWDVKRAVITIDARQPDSSLRWQVDLPTGVPVC